MNTTGTTSRLSTVDVISPPMTAIAIGERKLGSAVSKPNAIGSIPAPMAIVVMMIGRARLWQASSSASKRLIGALAPAKASSLALTRVSSARMRSARRSVSAARSPRSRRLPIGVATM